MSGSKTSQLTLARSLVPLLVLTASMAACNSSGGLPESRSTPRPTLTPVSAVNATRLAFWGFNPEAPCSLTAFDRNAAQVGTTSFGLCTDANDDASPDGQVLLIQGQYFDPSGHALGTEGFQDGERYAWLDGAEGVCGIRAAVGGSGFTEQLWTQHVGQAPRLIAVIRHESTPTVNYQVLACSERSELAVVAKPGNVWVISLATGRILWHRDYAPYYLGLAASPDATALAEICARGVAAAEAQGHIPWSATDLRSTATGAELRALPVNLPCAVTSLGPGDLGFTGQLQVGNSVLVDWKSDRMVFTASEAFTVGRWLAPGAGALVQSSGPGWMVVHPDGSLARLPQGYSPINGLTPVAFGA